MDEALNLFSNIRLHWGFLWSQFQFSQSGNIPAIFFSLYCWWNLLNENLQYCLSKYEAWQTDFLWTFRRIVSTEIAWSENKNKVFNVRGLQSISFKRRVRDLNNKPIKSSMEHRLESPKNHSDPQTSGPPGNGSSVMLPWKWVPFHCRSYLKWNKGLVWKSPQARGYWGWGNP